MKSMWVAGLIPSQGCSLGMNFLRVRCILREGWSCHVYVCSTVAMLEKNRIVAILRCSITSVILTEGRLGQEWKFMSETI